MKQYLENLIKVVNDDDWKKLKAIDLKTSKLKDYLHLLLDKRSEEYPDNAEVRKKLKIDDKLHRKMKSVLLTRCYETLAPEGGIQLLELLSRYRLYDHFTRELEKQELHMRKKPEKQKRDFYNYAFHGFRRLPFSLVDTEKLEEYGEKYLKTIDADKLGEETNIVKLRVVVPRILQFYFHLDNSKTGKQIYAELQKIKKSVTAKSTKMEETMLNFIFGIFHFYVDNDLDKSLDYLLKTKKLRDEYSIELTYDEYAALKIFIALNYYQGNKFKEAIEMIELVRTKFPPLFYNQTHIINRLVELYLIEGDLPKAKELLDNHMQKYLDILESDSAELASISFIKYYLLTGDYDKAYLYLDMARRFLNKKFYLGHDIEVRTLEILYFVHTGDYNFAKSLINRGIKYLHEKAKEKEVHYALQKFRLLQKVCKFNKAFIESSEDLYKQIGETFSGYQHLIGMLVLQGCKMRMEKRDM